MDNGAQTSLVKTLFALTLALAFGVGDAFASPEASAPQLVEQANQAYQSADYEGAIALYQQALSEGATNGHVLFNLGNAYFRVERLGRAIAAYRQALLDLPGDPDVLANLSLARKETKDRIASDTQLVSSITERILKPLPRPSMFVMERLFLSFYVLGWVSFLSASLFQLSRSKPFSYICFAAAFAFGALTYAVAPGRDGSARLYLGSARDEAPGVIVVPETKLYSGDGESYQTVFVLHDGAEVMTRERRKGWTEVLLPDGRRGWAKSSDIQDVSHL
ncbi:MAG: tetratricopeptide repeat protein [Bdellovibrionota bacterium]